MEKSPIQVARPATEPARFFNDKEEEFIKSVFSGEQGEKNLKVLRKALTPSYFVELNSIIGMGVDNFATPYMHFRNEYSDHAGGNEFSYVSDNKILFFGLRVSFDYRFGKMEFKQSKKKGIKNDDLKDDGGDQMGGGR